LALLCYSYFLSYFFPSENSETKRWIDLGLFTFQPSELMRFILPISAASFLTRNLETKIKDMWLVIILTFFCFYLVAIQPDLGNFSHNFISWVVASHNCRISVDLYISRRVYYNFIFAYYLD
jgi:cell division protein FtsW (lipid II flippase)